MRGYRERGLKDSLEQAYVTDDLRKGDDTLEQEEEEASEREATSDRDASMHALIALARSEFLDFYTKVSGSRAYHG